MRRNAGTNTMKERTPLLHDHTNCGLSLLFATLCIVDLFGVFPIIALPRAIIQCGWLGIPLVFLVFSLQIYTASLLGKSWIIATSLDPQLTRKNRYPLAAVTEMTLGPTARFCVTMLMDLTVFGGGIPNLLVASQNLQLFGLQLSGDNFNFSFCYWLLVVGILLCPVMWLGSPREMKWLATCSTIIVSLTAILAWWCVIADDTDDYREPIPIWPPWEKFISGYAILAFQFDVHPTLMTVQVDMQQPKDVDKAVLGSFFFTGSLFAVTTGLAAWKYGNRITANVLQLVPGGFPMQMCIFLAALQLCLSNALGHTALFQHLEDTLGIKRAFGWKRCVTRSALLMLAVALGESVPRFDVVMALIGGTLAGPLVFVLPPLIYSKVKRLEAMARRAPVIEVSSPSLCEKREGIEEVPDPNIHSQSVHYNIYGSRDRCDVYSYVYYDSNDGDTKTDQGCGQPIHLDASSLPPRQRRRLVDVELTRTKPQIFQDWSSYLIVFVGILLTVSSTYIHVKNTIRFVKFTPPCIINVTAAAAGLNFH